MVQPVELRYGVWLEGSPDEGIDVLTLCGLMADCIADAVLSLAMYQDAMMLPGPPTGDAWRAIRDRDYQARRAREAELEAEHPWGPDGDQEHHEWHRAIRDQADRDVTHAKWAAGELPQTYIARLCVIHKDSFMTSLARLRRALRNLTEFDAARGSAEIQAAIAAFDAALPNLTALRDSAEHSEDRLLGRDKHGNPLKAVPTTGTVGPRIGMIRTAGKALVVGDSLGPEYGATLEDGSYATIAMSPATLEIARATLQRVFDALPWREGSPHRYYPE